MTFPANPHVAAWLTLLNAQLATMTPARAAYEYDDAPQQGGDYLIIFLTRRFGGNRRPGGPLSPSGWRLAVRSVGTGVTNARVLLDRADSVIEQGVITVGSEKSTPAEIQTDDPIRQDEQYADVWSGLRSYTYTF